MDFSEITKAIKAVDESNLPHDIKEILGTVMLKQIPMMAVVHSSYPDEEGDTYIDCSCPNCNEDCSIGMIDNGIPDSPLIFYCNECGQALKIVFEEEIPPFIEKEDNVIFMFGKPKE